MGLIESEFHIYGNAPDEMIGRYVVNSMGSREIVTLKKIQWDYLDWLENKGADIAGYIAACDETNPDMSLSHALAWWVFWLIEEREEEGLPRPDWLVPDND